MCNEIQTIIRKDSRNNWAAKSYIDLTDKLQFTVSTTKTYETGALVTRASVGKRDGAFVCHTMRSDFSKTLAAEKYGRVTSKVVEKQHNEILENIEAVLQLAKKHYDLV